MFTIATEGSRRMVSAAAAVAIVAFAGLALDQGHLGGLPDGSVSIGELTPVSVMQMADITLPEITVTAARPTAGQRRVAARRRGQVAPTLLAAGRAALGADDVPATERTSSPSALLK